MIPIIFVIFASAAAAFTDVNTQADNSGIF
jgi:hypothetical protein